MMTDGTMSSGCGLRRWPASFAGCCPVGDCRPSSSGETTGRGYACAHPLYSSPSVLVDPGFELLNVFLLRVDRLLSDLLGFVVIAVL